MQPGLSLLTRRRALAAWAALALALLAPSPAGSSSASDVRRAAAYLVGRQQPNGAFFSPDLTADGVAEVVSSLVAAETSGTPIRRALSYLGERGSSRSDSGGRAGRIVMGLVAAGADPRRFGGTDYVAKLASFYEAGSGAYDRSTVYADALAVLGLLAAGDRPPERAIAYLRDNRCPGGGFSWRNGCLGVPDVDTTAAVVNALVAAGVGRGDPALAGARDFLARAQNIDGGFGLDATSPETNANSTGLALTTIVALGEEPGRPPWRQADGDDPVAALLRLQHSSGGFRFRASDAAPNDYATVQAIPGLAGRTYPIRPSAGAAGAGRARAPARQVRDGMTDTVAPPGPIRSANPGAAATPTPAAPALAAPSVLGTPASRTAGGTEARSWLPWIAGIAAAATTALLARRSLGRRRA